MLASSVFLFEFVSKSHCDTELPIILIAFEGTHSHFNTGCFAILVAYKACYIISWLLNGCRFQYDGTQYAFLRLGNGPEQVQHLDGIYNTAEHFVTLLACSNCDTALEAVLLHTTNAIAYLAK